MHQSGSAISDGVTLLAINMKGNKVRMTLMTMMIMMMMMMKLTMTIITSTIIPITTTNITIIIRREGEESTSITIKRVRGNGSFPTSVQLGRLTTINYHSKCSLSQTDDVI